MDPTPAVQITPPNGEQKPAPIVLTPAQVEEGERKRREAEIRDTGLKLKAEKSALNKERAAIVAQEKSLAKEKAEAAEIKKLWESRLTDPDGFMTKAYTEKWRDNLAKQTTGDTAPLAVQQLREEWEKERAERAAKDAAEKEATEKGKAEAAKAAAEEEERAFNEYQAEMAGPWIKEHEKDFPSLATTGLGSQIALMARAIYQKGGKLGDKDFKPGEMPDEMLVAKDLEEKLDKLLDTVYATPKWKERLAAIFRPTPAARKKEEPTYQVAPRKALSQDMAASGKAVEQHKPLTREERKARLLEQWSTKVPSST